MISASRLRRPSPSAPVIMARPVAACSRSPIWRNDGGYGACSISAPAPACWQSQRRDCCAHALSLAISTLLLCARREPTRGSTASHQWSLSHAPRCHLRAIVAHAPYHLIFANILLGPLTRLAVPLRKLAAPGARIVLSGLLPSHANAALAIYRAQGLILERRIQLEAWVTLVMRRPSPQVAQNKTAPGGDDRGGFAGEACCLPSRRTASLDIQLDQPSALVHRTRATTNVRASQSRDEPAAGATPSAHP